MRSDSEPVRILHVVPDLDGGGLQNGLVKIIQGLPRDEFRHEVCCLHTGGRFRSRIGTAVPVRELHAGWHDPRTPIKLALAIRRFRPAVVHARNWSTWPDAVFAGWFAPRHRLVFSFHGWDTDRPVNPLRAVICRQLARWTDGLCGVSRSAMRQFAAETGLPAERFEVIPNGVDTTRFRPRPDGGEVRRELGIAPDTVVIGSVGRLEPVKDYETLLAASAQLPRHPPYRCDVLLVGDGSERRRLVELCGTLGIAGRVHFVGWRDDPPRMMAAMDLFAMTSRREGLSNALLEAMACGLPVVATAVGGNTEVIDDRVHGRLVKPGDTEGLVGALIDLIRNKHARQRMGRHARTRVVRDYDVTRTLRRYADLYRRMARRNDPHPTPIDLWTRPETSPATVPCRRPPWRNGA